MTSSLGGSMGSSCLQQRADGYPAYVFHEPLHSLSQSYSHAAHQSAAVAAHSQPHRGLPTSSHGPTASSTPGAQTGPPSSSSYQPTTSTATGKLLLDSQLNGFAFEEKTNILSSNSFAKFGKHVDECNEWTDHYNIDEFKVFQKNIVNTFVSTSKLA